VLSGQAPAITLTRHVRCDVGGVALAFAGQQPSVVVAAASPVPLPAAGVARFSGHAPTLGTVQDEGIISSGMPYRPRPQVAALWQRLEQQALEEDELLLEAARALVALLE